MQRNISLWVQSSGQNEPDLLSINGERVFPEDCRWRPNLAAILTDNTSSMKIAKKEHLTIFRRGGKIIIKGVLSQKDKSNRHRVFTAQIQSVCMKSALKRLQNELTKYNLSYSNECQVSIKSFLFSLNFHLIALGTFIIFLAAVILIKQNII